MDDFEDITTGDFDNLSRAISSLTDEQRAIYAAKFPQNYLIVQTGNRGILLLSLN